MFVYPLSSQESRLYTHKIVLTHADLTETATNTAQTIPVLSLAIGDVVSAAAYRLVTAFTDASDAAFNVTSITVGDGGAVARYIPSKELNSNGTEIINWATSQATSTIPYAYLAADNVDVVFTSMAAKSLVDIDAGEVHIYLSVDKTY